ncbi:MAG: cyclic nucleotide-binding domain-containing protein [Chloroflexota bacterium]|nr:cyclic nucleotide-binding domain-containing protein [Chloroflexota bacterium]
MISTREKIKFMKYVSSFKNLSEEQLGILADLCEEKSYPQGDLIFQQGDTGSALYIVIEGQVLLERELEQRTDTISMNMVKPYTSFGEISLFHDAPRSVTATAVQDVKLLRVDNENFLAFICKYPDLLLELNQVLSQRLLEAYDKISELMRLRKPRELHNLYDKLDF